MKKIKKMGPKKKKSRDQKQIKKFFFQNESFWMKGKRTQ